MNEGVYRSPKWLRKFIDYEISTGEDIKGKVSKIELRRNWERRWNKVDEDQFKEFYKDEFPKEFKDRYNGYLYKSNLREIKDEWLYNFDLWKKYDLWLEKKAKKEAEQERIKQELDDIWNNMIKDFFSNQYRDKFSTPTENGKIVFKYTFENGDKFSFTENAISFNNITYTVGMSYRQKFVMLANKIIENGGTQRPGGNRKSTHQGSTKTSKYSNHPKWSIYQSIKDTVERRKEELRKMPKNDPERTSRQNELDSAERRLKEFQNKYKFEKLSSFLDFTKY